MTNWISFEEKLPPKKTDDDDGFSETYLISDGENISMGYFEFEYFAEDHPEDYPLKDGITYSSECWHEWSELLNSDVGGWPKVTHWAELPNPPNQK